MDTIYLKAMIIIQNTRINLEKIITETNEKSFENERACNAIENLFSEFETVVHTIDYYSKPIKEGYLIKKSNGVFALEYINGGSSYPLNCGDDIEIFINVEGWIAGRVESNLRNRVGYYFYNEEPEKHALYSGMKARVRVNY